MRLQTYALKSRWKTINQRAFVKKPSPTCQWNFQSPNWNCSWTNGRYFLKIPYIVTNAFTLHIKRTKIAYNDSETLSSSATKISKLIYFILWKPLTVFKTKIKPWATNSYPSRIWKKYIGRIEFIWDVPVIHFCIFHFIAFIYSILFIL